MIGINRTTAITVQTREAKYTFQIGFLTRPVRVTIALLLAASGIAVPANASDAEYIAGIAQLKNGDNMLRALALFFPAVISGPDKSAERQSGA